MNAIESQKLALELSLQKVPLNQILDILIQGIESEIGRGVKACIFLSGQHSNLSSNLDLKIISQQLWSTQQKKLGTFHLCFQIQREPLPEHHAILKSSAHTASLVIERYYELEETKQIEIARQRAEQQLSQIFEQAPVGICVLEGPNHIYSFMNPLCYTNVSGGYKDVIGQTVREGTPEIARQGFADLLDQVYRSGEVFVGEEVPLTAHSHDEKPRYFNFIYQPKLNHQGEVDGIICVFTDVTDQVELRKNLEAERESLLQQKNSAEAANLAKTNFLANMSHEIRTPLGVIMGYADLIYRQELSVPELEDYSSAINRNSIQLLKIIDDILDLSKVEAGKMIIENIDFSLPELINDFASMIEIKARNKRIGFKLAFETALPEFVNGDPTRIRQILMNIVGNAIKFTDRGRVELIVSYENQALKFKVKDTGRGITRDQAQNLFQAFTQADPSTTRQFGGTGLGLVLTKKLCQALGGDFTLQQSSPWTGSIFVASIQLKVSEANAHIQPAPNSCPFHSELDAPKRLSQMKILLVEDSPDNQSLYKIILSREGVEIDIASDGSQGVEKALNEKYALVLMDVQMPKMDGHEATQTLRARGYQGPIVALTAHAMNEERERCLKSGFTDYLSKPIQRDRLVEILMRYRAKNPPNISLH
jgi:signal transduction histidine kinase/ActR/RegA family two-component response regulator